MACGAGVTEAGQRGMMVETKKGPREVNHLMHPHASRQFRHFNYLVAAVVAAL